MRFSQWCQWRVQSDRMWRCVFGCVQTSTSKEHIVLNFGIKQSLRHCLTLKMNTLCCYTTLELYTQQHGHITKELNFAVCSQICDMALHRHLRYHGSVQSLHFLLPVCGVLISTPTWRVSSWHQTVTEVPACPFIWYCRAASHSSMLANTRWWKGLCSKVFQHSGTKTVAVGNELHTEYNVIFIKYSFTQCKIIT